MAFVLTVELDKICRACLTTTEPMKDLYSVCSPDVFLDCTSVEISENDCLPNMICDICLELLNKLYYFKQVVVRSNVILREHGPIIQLPEDFEITDETHIALDNFELCDKTTDDIVCVEPILPGLGDNHSDILLETEQSYDDSQDSILNTNPTLLPNFINDTEANQIQSTAIEKLKCAKCNKIFKNYENLEAHVRKHLDRELPEDFEITDETYIALSDNFELCDKTTDDIVCVEPILPGLGDNHSDILLETEPSHDESQDSILNTNPTLLPNLISDTEANQIQTTAVEKLKCAKCNKIFKKYENLEAHMRKHFDKKPDIHCEVCHKKFNSTKNLKSHMRVHTKSRRYQCTMCGKYFGYLNVLKNHELIHAGVKKYACHVCDAKFVQSFNLKMHMKTHINEKSYCCSKCGKRFSQSGNLKSHLIRHTGIKNLACHVCDMRFFVKGDLKKHMTSHSASKPFPCEICHKMFKTRFAYDTHMRSHTGERPYPCELCPKKFITRRDLRNHTMIHTGTKPHKCDLCQQAFIQKCALNRHMKSHMRQVAQNVVVDQTSLASFSERSVTVLEWPQIV